MILSYRLFGYCRVTVGPDCASLILNLCMHRQYPYDDLKAYNDGKISLCVNLHTAKLLLHECKELGIHIEQKEYGGLPIFVKKYRYRVGLAVGVPFAVLLVIVSSLFVWDVRVSGNVNLTDSDVEKALAGCGFGVGSLKIGFRADQLENRVLIYDDRIAWISVNLKGTVANVQIRETAKKPKSDDLNKPANIVAARSGKIERIELDEGNVVIGAGQRVNEGELLVSGLYDSTQLGFRWTHASARIYARCVREIQIAIPTEYEIRVYSDKNDKSFSAFCERSLIFFSKSINFTKSTGNSGLMCDTIENIKSLSFVKGVDIPVSIRQVWYLPYTLEKRVRTYDEMEELAYLELSRRINEIPGGAELIKKTVATSCTSEGFFLNCTIVCIEDIAKTQEFEVVQEDQKIK